jgi:hypothetical protein
VAHQRFLLHIQQVPQGFQELFALLGPLPRDCLEASGDKGGKTFRVFDRRHRRCILRRVRLKRI